MPRDAVNWQAVSDGAAKLLRERLPCVCLTSDCLHHHRAQGSFAALVWGWSYGGGQTEPGELQDNIANTRVTDELLAHKYFRRLAHFGNSKPPPPQLHSHAHMLAVLLAKRSMRKNFPGSVFAACTFNLGPRTIYAPYLNFANLSWGWCAITALGNFDPDYGGHLILWDLRLVIRFPPGSTTLLPSALIHHSNVPIRVHEDRFSFVQYSAGGLFWWVRNRFQSDEEWVRKATPQEKEECIAENRDRWEQDMKMFSAIDELGSRAV
ncbi:hypothetical protein C8R45DRAFT_835326 [Mycena sanguinolenta]|nr:hypothetical protein C8R45DRAFT_835326 [Mycena sanguinolenta]